MNNVLNNKDCPALMSDGRLATDYRSSCIVHNLISRHNGIRNSNEQRLFLQRNADALMEMNLSHFHKKAGCNSCEYYHVDPNGNDSYWDNYKQWLGFNQ